MRCSKTVVFLLVVIFVAASTGCHSTGIWNSQDWATSSFNPATWRMGVKPSATSLATAPPAKPSITSTPTYPNTADTSALASSTTPPKVEYPTTAASFNSPSTDDVAIVPQQGRYGSPNAITPNTVGGFNNPIYDTPANAALVPNPYRATAPAVPEANGSLATVSPYSGQTAPTYSPAPYSNQSETAYNDNTNNTGAGVDAASRYQADVASSTGKIYSPTYRNDSINSYNAQTAVNTSTATSGSPLPKVVGGYPTTSATSPAISTATGLPAAATASRPSGPYPTVTSPNAAASAPSDLPTSNNYPINSPAVTAPPAATYQPGTSGYQPGANQFVPGNTGYTPAANGYQMPATRATEPVQSGQSYDNNLGYTSPAVNTPQMVPLDPSSEEKQSKPFRPGSTANVEDYPWSSDSTSTSSTPSAAYPSTQATTPVKTSINTSNVMPVGFDQDTAPVWR